LSENVAAIVTDETFPPCPKCGSSEYVHRAGFRLRVDAPHVQAFQCRACGRGTNKFIRDSDRRPPDYEKSREARLAGLAKAREVYQATPKPKPVAVAVAEKAQQKLEPEPAPDEDIRQPIRAGSWKIKAKLAQSLSAMFQHAHGFRPDVAAMDVYVSTLLENEVASFRLTHSDYIFRSQSRPPKKVLDPARTIRGVNE
jgi:hypothetical protein